MTAEEWTSRFGLAPAAAAEIATQLAALPDPKEAEQGLERLLGQLADDARGAFPADPLTARGLVRLAYAAPFLLRHLGHRAEKLAKGLLDGLDATAALLPWQDYLPAATFPELGDDELMRGLRLWKYNNYARLTAQDLLGVHATARTCALISDLAEGMLSLCYRQVFHALARRHGLPIVADGSAALGTVIGMGKLGGRELNYASDVDVIFIHEGDDSPCRDMAAPDTPALLAALAADDWPAVSALAARLGRPGDRALSAGEFHNRLARQVVRLLGANTAEGIGFRVDTDLRPQGRSGLLAPALAFLGQYYDVHGREWERTALLKARRVAGAPAVYERFAGLIRPFVYRRYLDYSAVEGIAIVKHDIDRNHRAALDTDLKLGRGGIRENEFLVQALQLLYGGKKPELQVTSHQEAVERLVAAEVLEAADGAAHLDAYWLLRATENRLQMVAEAQTHALPDDPAARARIFFDFSGTAHQEAAEERLAEARRGTEARFRELFAGMSGEGFPEPDAWQEAFRRHLPEPEREEALARVDGLLNRLMKTRLGERCVFKIERLLTQDELYRHGTEPAFPRWLEFFEQIGNRNAILSLVEANPGVVAWSSRFFTEGGQHARQLIRHPEFLETFVAEAPAVETPWEPFSAVLEHARDEEEFILELQRAKAQAMIQILSTCLEAPEDTAHRLHLSGLADATVALCARYAWRLVTARYGTPEGGGEELAGFTVLAMGKLGSQEMRFGSDLDLVFVYEREGATSGGKTHYEFYTRVAQKLSNLLTAPTQFGKLYEIDHRLRPFGQKGVLVPTQAAFASFTREADVWNFQAFTRIRRLCGDAALGDAVVAAIAEAWPAVAPEPPLVARAVREMLGRLVAEHAPSLRASRPRLSLKYAVGGLIGFEFLRQCHFLLTHRAQGGPWLPPADAEAVRALLPPYDTLGALDERLSFYEPGFEHEVTPAMVERWAVIRERWSYAEVEALAAAMERDVEAAFQALAGEG